MCVSLLSPLKGFPSVHCCVLRPHPHCVSPVMDSSGWTCCFMEDTRREWRAKLPRPFTSHCCEHVPGKTPTMASEWMGLGIPPYSLFQPVPAVDRGCEDTVYSHHALSIAYHYRRVYRSQRQMTTRAGQARKARQAV